MRWANAGRRRIASRLHYGVTRKCGGYSFAVATNPDRASYFPAIEKKHGQPMEYWFGVMAELKGQKYPEQMACLQENHDFSRAHANALVLYSRGSISAHRFDDIDGYLASLDQVKQETIREIMRVLAAKHRRGEWVLAWNKPLFALDGAYVFGVSASSQHLLIAPFDTEVLQQLKSRLVGYKVNKKTVQVPVDWPVDRQLIIDMVDLQPRQ